jgi:hypothetical protein
MRLELVVLALEPVLEMRDLGGNAKRRIPFVTIP